MSYITRNLKQKATYWAPTGVDDFGNQTFAAPITLNCRWEGRTELFIDIDGKEQRSAARVYVNQDVLVGGYLFEGVTTVADPKTIKAAREIRDFRKIPNLRATEFERRALL